MKHGSAGISMKPLRVLIVDDEPSICRALVIALERAGCIALSATSGSAALDLLRHEPVDVLVMDLRMPDLRGDVVAHFAAAIQPNLRGATLMITGDVTENGEELLDVLGCPYMRKPFSLSDVLATVFALAPADRFPARRLA